MHLHREVTIEAAPEIIWRCLTETDLRQKWLSQLVSEEVDTPGARGVGTTATLRLRQKGEVLTYRSTVIDWEPPRKLSVGLTGGKLPPDAALGVIYELLPSETAGSTILHYDFHMPMKNLLMRLLTPLIRLGAGQAIDPDLARLKTLAESLRAGTG